MMTTMTNSRPYLIRAIYEWICDNNCTPYLYANTAVKNVLLPEHLLVENPLILNVAPSACNNLLMDNEGVSFQARFSGRVFDIYLPIDAVIAIVARENGQGMTFEMPPVGTDAPEEESITAEDAADNSQSQSDPTKAGTTQADKADKKVTKRGKSGLKVVK